MDTFEVNPSSAHLIGTEADIVEEQRMLQMGRAFDLMVKANDVSDRCDDVWAQSSRGVVRHFIQKWHVRSLGYRADRLTAKAEEMMPADVPLDQLLSDR